MTTSAAEDKLTRAIIRQIEERSPENVEQLVVLVKQAGDFQEERILGEILQLQSQGKIRFQTPPQPKTQKLSSYLRTENAYWYWITIAFIVITTIIVFTVPEDAYPLVYARYVLGTIFVIWLPGYTFVRALFPLTPPRKTSETNLDTVERIALSLGISLALVPLVGLLLNYTPWGIRLTPIVLSLLALALIFATAAIIREWSHRAKL